jgi:hypothetical protein
MSQQTKLEGRDLNIAVAAAMGINVAGHWCTGDDDNCPFCLKDYSTTWEGMRLMVEHGESIGGTWILRTMECGKRGSFAFFNIHNKGLSGFYSEYTGMAAQGKLPEAVALALLAYAENKDKAH